MASIGQAFEAGVSSVSQTDYCAKQQLRGLDPAVCAQRFQAWQMRVRGKGAKMESNWAHGKGSYGGRS
jgi:hypothetical protein